METNTFDLAGRVIRRVSTEAGTVRTLYYAQSQPVRHYDAFGRQHSFNYDALRRPLARWFRAATSEVCKERYVYGEMASQAELHNLRGQLYRVYDDAGVQETSAFNLLGLPTSEKRTLASSLTTAPDWTAIANLTTVAAIDSAAASQLESVGYAFATIYNALGNVTSRVLPDSTEVVPGYNAAGQLAAVSAHLRGAAGLTAFVVALAYNARGQRTRIERANGVDTDYTYDPNTFRLTGVYSASGGAVLQDLTYIHDPVGNIVEATGGVGYGNSAVSGSGLYEYDALYRLTKAEGREHPSQQPTHADPGLLGLTGPNDLQGLVRYAEVYTYDASGNLTRTAHTTPGGGGIAWTREQTYLTTNNRLNRSSAAGGTWITYSHNAAGQLVAMPHLPQMNWNEQGQLKHTNQGGGGDTYFRYDASGQRVRKAYYHSGLLEERIYLGEYEIYRKISGGNVRLERETVHFDDGAQRVAMVETKTIDTTINGFTPVTRQRYQLSNHLGSATFELDETGAVFSYEEYHPYGTTAFRAHDGAVDVSAKRYRYTGKEKDEETGLYYHGARYYAPWLSRWVSADPIGIRDGTNVYAYVRGNPVAWVDPGGMDGEPANVAETDPRAKAIRRALPGAEIQYGPPGANSEELTRLSAKTGAVIIPALSTDPGTRDGQAGMQLHWALQGGDPAQREVEALREERHETVVAPASETVLMGVSAKPGADLARGLSDLAEAEDPVEFMQAGFWLVAGLLLFSGRKGGKVGDAADASKGGPQFWTRTTNFGGNKVYQRNDLINPKLVDARGRTNVERMQKGLAPIGPDGHSIELHHMLQTADGPIAEVTRTFHTSNRSTLHINPSSTPSGIDRSAFDAWRRAYWRSRAGDF